MALKQITIGKLKVGMSIANPVYTRIHGKSVLLIAENTLIGNESQIRRLIDAGISTVVIDTERGIDTFQSLPAKGAWKDREVSINSGDLSEKLRLKYFQTFVTALTAIITKNPTTRTLIAENRVSFVLKGILDRIDRNPDILIALIRLRSVNEYTFIHSVLTSMVCVSLASELGFSYDDTLRFGLGVMLANIGMTSYPSTVLHRRSGLSRREREEIQKHPIYTVDYLKYVGLTDKLIHTVVLQHHERYNGSGYPYGLKGNEIHKTSKLFAITDVYMAMTSTRPHRAGYPPHMVLADILQMSGKLFDPATVNFFIKHLGVFPVGNMVELTGGQYGIVASTNHRDPLRPVAIVFETKRKLRTGSRSIPGDTDKTISRGNWQLVDLARGGHEFGKVKRGLDHRKFRLNPTTYLDKV